MKNKNHFLLMFVMLVLGSLYTSCSKNDTQPLPNAPAIQLTEVGKDNGLKAYLGTELSLKAEIVAAAKIKSIDLKIENENDATKNINLSLSKTEYVGKETISLTEMIPVPKDLPEGDYHLHLTVTDYKSQKTEATSDVSLVKKGPEIENLILGEKDFRDNNLANIYLNLYIAGDITSEKELTSVNFSAKEKNGGEGKLEEKELIRFFKKESNKLDAKVEIPLDAKPGKYEMLLKLKDGDGNVREVKRDFEVNGKPSMEDFELGSGHGSGERTDHIGKAGDPSGLHIQGSVYCVLNRMKGIIVTMEQKVEKNPYKIVTHFDKSTNYFGALYGVRNDDFHQHIFLPKDMPLGEYNFTFKVEDLAGQVYERHEILKVQKYTPISS